MTDLVNRATTINLGRLATKVSPTTPDDNKPDHDRCIHTHHRNRPNTPLAKPLA